MSERGEWVRRLAACALFVAGCGPGSQGEEMAGSTPAEGDIADPRRINTWQAGTPDGTVDNTSHSECDAGDCVDILLQRGLYFCGNSIDSEDFEVVLRSQTLPSTVIRSIHFGGARGALVPSAWNVRVGSACGSLQAGTLLPDTVTIRLDTSVLTDEVDRSNLRIQVRTPTSSNPMLVVPVTVDPSNGSTTVGEPRQLRAQQTLATFTLARESGHGEPVLEDNVFLDTDRVRTGPCLPGIGWCAGDTAYLSPHGALTVRLASSDGLAADGSGMILGAYMQYEGDFYVGPFNDGATSRNQFEEVPFAIHFQTDEDGGGAIRVAARTSCVNNVCTTPEHLPLAEHVPVFEVTHDGTLFRLGDPERLLVGRSTQSTSGMSFRPGTDGEAVSFTVAPVAFDEPFYQVASGSTVTFSGVTANPNVTRVEIGYAADSTIGEATVAPDGTFAISSQFTFDWGADRFIEVRAYWGSVFVGHDRVPLELQGPREDSDGDGVPDMSDNCVGVHNPNQLDLNPATPAGLGCESDSDGDGRDDSAELREHTSPLLSDTDGDGLDDDVEYSIRGLEQRLSGVSPDTDGDGVLDVDETTDANSDGIPDAFDPNNATIGVDPASGLFLVREEWRNEFKISVPGSGPNGLGEYLVEAKVEFTLNYLLAESSTANWLSTDALASPLMTHGVLRRI